MLSPVHLLEMRITAKQTLSMAINFRVVAQATPNCPKEAVLNMKIAARGKVR